MIKMGIKCSFDLLQYLADWDGLLRQFLGHSYLDSHGKYSRSTLVRNINLLTPELIDQINLLIVKRGHQLVGHQDQALAARADSFPVETDVHYPTDLNLLFDCVRFLIQQTSRQSKKRHLKGWRQSDHLLKAIKKLFNAVRTSQRAHRRPDQVRDYLKACRQLLERAAESWAKLQKKGVKEKRVQQAQTTLKMGWILLDQVERRLLKGETIPSAEKIYSIFEPHTRWLQKGKAGKPVEFGVPVCILEDEHQFILTYRVMWEEEDVEVAVPIIKDTLANYPELSRCSFDKGFHSPENQKQLPQMIEEVILPKKGKWSAADRERETTEFFQAGRKQHPAVESAINHLEHRGLDRVYSYGADGFKRAVALAIMTANLSRLGSLLRSRELERLKKQSIASLAA